MSKEEARKSLRKSNLSKIKPATGQPETSLCFKSLVKHLSNLFLGIKDKRQQKKIKYSIKDCLMSGLSMMYFQDSSLLQFQRRMQEEENQNNLANLFDVFEIPADTQMRKIIDDVDPEETSKIFSIFFKLLQRGKHLEKYVFLHGEYLIAIDGSEYFSSEKIQCPSCLTKTSKNGKVRCLHQILQPVLIHPNMKQVIPLAPEAIRNTDGTEKQDCEINAAKRVVKKIREAHPKLKIVIVGDGLYSKQPFIEALKAVNMSFILVSKPDDHKKMFEQVENRMKLNKVNEKIVIDEKGNKHIYHWTNGVKLNGKKNSLQVNFIKYELYNTKLEKVTYKNTWILNNIISENNVEEMVLGGRARWKIENETFNTLKNQGYHLEHNYGHGVKNLSNNFFILNLIAFFIHQIQELTDKLYNQCRERIGTRLEFFNHLRIIINLIVFESWDDFLAFLSKKKKLV